MFTNTPTMGQVLPLIPSQSCMHIGTCTKSSSGALADMAILYKVVDKLGKFKQAIHHVCRALYFAYCLDWSLILPWASRKSFGATAVFAKF